MKRILVCLVPLVLGACYTYTRVPANTIAAGVRTNVSLTSQGSVQLEPALGSNVEELQGTLTRTTPDSLEMYVTSVKRRGNSWALVSTPVVLASNGHAEVRTRRFSASKSAIAALGIIGVVWLGISTDLFGFGQDRDSTDPPPPPPPPAN